MIGSVLLIDDDADVLRAIGNYFEQLGWEVTRELSGEAGLATYDRLRPEVVMLDLHLPGMDGMEVLEKLRERDAGVILLTGNSDVPTAVRAMQLGAENFLSKPVDMTHLSAAAARVADKARLRRVNEALFSQTGAGHGLDSLGTSAAMRAFAHQVSLLAQSERTTVLLLGESGSGKGWVREDDPQPWPARQDAVRRGQLRRPQRHLPRLGALRAREGRVHGRQGSQAGSLRDRRPRDDLPRRNRRPQPRAAAQAAQGPGNQDLSPRWAVPGRSRSMSGWWRPRTRTWPPRWSRVGSARTSTTGSA